MSRVEGVAAKAERRAMLFAALADAFRGREPFSADIQLERTEFRLVTAQAQVAQRVAGAMGFEHVVRKPGQHVWRGTIQAGDGTATVVLRGCGLLAGEER